MTASANITPAAVPPASESESPVAGPRLRPRHIPALDGLRGIAILMVLAYHFMGYQTKRGWALQTFFAFNRAGWVGVDLFFVLSGFLITRILLDVLGSEHYFRDFYVRRTLRIFPLYYLTLAIVFLLARFVPALQSPAVELVSHRQAWLWLYGANIFDTWHQSIGFRGDWIQLDHLWSLAVEEQFYLVWPPLVLLCGIRRLPTLCMTIIVGALALRCGLVLGGAPSEAPYLLMPCRMDALVMGALLATMQVSWSSAAISRIAAPALFIGAVMLFAWALHRRNFAHADPAIMTVGFTVLALVFASLLHLIAVAPADSILSRALCLPVLSSIGKYSYAIYIFHWLLAPGFFATLLPEQWFFTHLRYVPGLLLRFAIITSFTYGLALVSWHLFERQFLKLKRFFDYRATPAPAGISQGRLQSGPVRLIGMVENEAGAVSAS